MVETLSSPLTQVNAAGTVREPKAALLYVQLLDTTRDQPLSAGFWVELFLLPASPAVFATRLAECQKSDLFALLADTRTFFAAGGANLTGSDPHTARNACILLSCFVDRLAALKLSTSELIELMAGQLRIGALLNDITAGITRLLENSSSLLDAQRLLAKFFTLLSNTGVATTLARKNFFTALARTAASPEMLGDSAGFARTMALLGYILAQNRQSSISDVNAQRMIDYVDRKAILTMCDNATASLVSIERQLAEQQESSPAFSVSSLKNWFGLKKDASQQQQQQQTESTLSPIPALAQISGLYEFIGFNETMALIFTSSAAYSRMLCLGARLAQQKRQTPRLLAHATMLLLTTRRLLEYPQTVECLLDDATRTENRLPAYSAMVPRQPFGPRQRLAALLDLLQLYLRSYIRAAKPDEDLAVLSIETTFQAFAVARQHPNVLRRSYQWDQFWQTLLSLLRVFLSTEYESTIVVKYFTLVSAIILSPQVFTPETHLGILTRLYESKNSIGDLANKYKLTSEPSFLVVQTILSQWELAPETPDVDSILRQGEHSLDLARAKNGNISKAVLISEAMPSYREQDHKLLHRKLTRYVCRDLFRLLD